MEISVKMDAAEFQEFMEYREAKGKFEAALERVKRAPAMIAASLVYAVEQIGRASCRERVSDNV